ncbi:hypothetical protein [Chryseobacterium carnipullorum]|uniref:hypothetical protein n=1 Tax=Chryseobacterium carnipullorum TaxID=1124835 RepID=UPI000FE23284|nr:hypothetical protein [Chryseobacterium carnipullorum]
MKNLVLAGITAGNNGIATSNAAISTNLYLYNGTAFIAKFTPNGQQVYGSYFNLRYGIKRIAKDDAGNIYVAGDVHRDYNNSGPGTLGTHQQTVIGESNAYVAKLNGNLQLLWGTYFWWEKTDMDFRVILMKEEHIQEI